MDNLEAAARILCEAQRENPDQPTKTGEWREAQTSEHTREQLPVVVPKWRIYADAAAGAEVNGSFST